MNINKTQALERLKAIENETKELRAIINKKDDWTSVVDIESACLWLGERDLDVCEYRNLIKDRVFSERTINQKALEVCIKAVNTENGTTWKPNWIKTNQKKWISWFDKISSSWLAYGPFGYGSCSYFGSGFYYETEEKARHGANHFKKYYDIWLG